MSQLDTSSFAKAIGQLEAGLQDFQKMPELTIVRDGLIQRFEFTYEISYKMLKRFLEATSANPTEVDQMAFQDLIRLGSERGLLRSGWDTWREYRRCRGTTSHTYDESKALEVVAVIPEFLKEARYLYEQLVVQDQ